MGMCRSDIPRRSALPPIKVVTAALAHYKPNAGGGVMMSHPPRLARTLVPKKKVLRLSSTTPYLKLIFEESWASPRPMVHARRGSSLHRELPPFGLIFTSVLLPLTRMKTFTGNHKMETQNGSMFVSKPLTRYNRILKFLSAYESVNRSSVE
jgi:hypothetical protein